MCTVTLTSLKDGFVLTSNRDEAIARKTLPPKVYEEGKVQLLYPRDQEAGGSWIGLSDQNRTICLLNGGYEPHNRKPPYKRSRGLVVKDLLKAADLQFAVNEYDYKGIEPFTCVIVDYSEAVAFYELVWDGVQKHYNSLPMGSYIWSSSLLYSKEVRRERENRFLRFKAHQEMNPKNLLDFHASRGSQKDEGLIIDRGFLKTCSITQVLKQEQNLSMQYHNLLKEETPSLLRFRP